METGKAVKVAAIYTLPWFVLSLLLGWVIGFILDMTGMSAQIMANQYGWLLSGLLSIFIVWLAWLKFDIASEYLDKLL